MDDQLDELRRLLRNVLARPEPCPVEDCLLRCSDEPFIPPRQTKKPPKPLSQRCTCRAAIRRAGRVYLQSEGA